ncbi:MAG: Histidinol-phosphatase (EC [uncultured Sulfurovum sp.]|uniref:Histidinol-phosphatase n=1 Tax=uncultured Sulfurovum sp. TaxID=269237 RepID=A0A6S6S380_9BACT|nr:MAG: Histidinol-phosphatase (EC [uncultured Sulfurovum sp.]
MRIDLHNHTTRCNHAKGSMQSYIERAIELGIDIYGFSEHAPMDFDEYYRLKFSEMSDYVKDVKSLQETYKNNIEILLGYEVDYLKGHMDERVLNSNVDYFIGSIHFLDEWGFDNPEFKDEYKNRNIDEIWQEYFDNIEAMAKTKRFDIVGHLDLIKIFNFMPTKDIRLIAKDAFTAIKKSNMVLELNTAGLRKPCKEIYPSQSLLEMAYELNIPITFSSDAHAIGQVGFKYDEATKLAKNIGYTKAVTFKQREQELLNF